MVNNVNIRITSLPTQNIQRGVKHHSKSTGFNHLNKPSSNKPDFLAKKNTKSLDSNNIILIKKKTVEVKPLGIADNKGVILYQQVERGNVFSNRVELVNRFHFKV